MRLFLDSFWRAVAYCLHPRVILLSLLPLVVMLVVAGGLGYFYWDAAIDWTRGALDAWPFLTSLWGWIEHAGASDVRTTLAPLVLVLVATPLIALLSLVLVVALMAPALTRLVAERRFPDLTRKKGGSAVGSVVRATGATLLALIALVVSMPFWLIPPLVLVLPPLIWGWLTYRVMTFDALAEHASAEERSTLMRLHRTRLLGMGVICGYLGTVPSIVWASGVLFAAAFVVLVPLAIWIYTLMFAFSALWFGHYGLDALAQLRAQRSLAATALNTSVASASPISL